MLTVNYIDFFKGKFSWIIFSFFSRKMRVLFTTSFMSLFLTKLVFSDMVLCGILR